MTLFVFTSYEHMDDEVLLVWILAGNKFQASSQNWFDDKTKFNLEGNETNRLPAFSMYCFFAAEQYGLLLAHVPRYNDKPILGGGDSSVV